MDGWMDGWMDELRQGESLSYSHGNMKGAKTNHVVAASPRSGRNDEKSNHTDAKDGHTPSDEGLGKINEHLSSLGIHALCLRIPNVNSCKRREIHKRCACAKGKISLGYARTG
jgi:hypothetical protein